MEKQLYALAVAVLILWRPGAEANDAAAQAITDVCKEDDYLCKIGEVAAEKLNPIKAALGQLKQQRMQYQIAATAERNPKRRFLLVALWMQAEQKIAEAESSIEEVESIVNQLLTAIARQRGVIAAAAEATKLQIADAASGHDAHSGGGNTVGLNFAVQNKHTAKCTITKDSATPTFSTQPNFEQLTELKLTAETDIGKHLPAAKATVTASGSCNDGGGKAKIAQALASCSLTSGSTTDWVYTPMSEHSSSAATKLYKGDQRNQGCAEELDDSKIQDDSQKKLAKAICNYLKLNVKTPTPLDEENGETLAADPIVLKTVRNCNADFATIEDAVNTSKNKVLKDYITDAFDKNPGEFAKKFIASVGNTDVPTRLTKTQETQNITALATTTAVAATLGHLEGQRIKRELETEKKSALSATVDPAKEEKCKGKPQGECKEENGCEFKDGKCKLKDGVKAEKEGKTTNTTGSNSFVISKAPLWLAFFIV